MTLVSVDDPVPDIGEIIVSGDKVTYKPGPDGDKKCRKLAGTYPAFDGYVVVMNYVIEDADDQLQDDSTITIKVKCLRAKPIAKPDEDTTDDEYSNYC